MMSTLVQTNGFSSASDPSGTASVRDFFSAIPWTGQPLPKAWDEPTGDAIAGVDTSPMSLSVKTFFSRFAWDGKPTVAAPLTPLEIQPDIPSQEDSLTLDGFADLF